MSIYKGNKKIGSFYKGSQAIGKIYKGTLVVYESWKKLIASGVPPLTLLNCKGVDLVDYKIYGNSVQSKLPSEYQQVEYIQTSGTAYIDTGIIPKETFKYDFSIKPLTKTMGPRFFGSYDGLMIGIHHTDSSRWRIGSGAGWYDNDDWGNIDYENFTHFVGESNKLSINDYTVERSFGVGTNGWSIYLLAINYQNAPNNNTSNAMQYCKIYDKDAKGEYYLAYDFIPCYRKSDNVIGMYDLVNNVFHTNAGTGEFTKGNDAPTPITPIEIESVGDKTKNLFDYKWFLDANNDWIEGSYWRRYVQLKPNTTYTIWSDLTTTVEDRPTIFVAPYTEPGGSFDNASANGHWANSTGEIRKATFTTNDTGLIIIKRLIYNANRDERLTKYFTNPNVKIQLEESNVQTEYEPYGYKVPVISRGKNIFNPEWVLESANNDWIEGSYDRRYERLKPNTTYTVWSDIPTDIQNKVTIFISPYLEVYDNPQANGLWANSTGTFRKATFTTDETGLIILKRIISWNSTDQMVIDMFNNPNVQIVLEESPAPTDYEPFIKPSTTNIYLNEPLRKIGESADCVDFENKKVVRNIKETTITGEMCSSLSVRDTNNVIITSGIDDIKMPNDWVSSKNIIKSNCFGTMENATGWSDASNVNKIAKPMNNTSVWVGIGAKITTLEEAKVYIDELKPTLHYALATPTEETIELPNIPTLKGTTIIEVDTTIQPSNMEVVYIGKE